jgi:mono/diheme cytochrome c family protein
MKKTKLLGLFSAMALVPALADASEEEITYANQVSRLIQDNCEVCHQPGGVGPMSFTSYEEVRPWAPLISLRVEEREMPPYQYDHDIGIQELKNDWRMSDEDINTIVSWVNAGSPMGNPEDLPPPKAHPVPGEWRFGDELGPPDHIVYSSKWDVPANGQDLWWEPTVPSGITENRCIKAVETLPSAAARGSTHHAVTTFLVENDEGEWEWDSLLSEYALGKLGEKIPEGACRVAPADSKIWWSVHYYPDGTAVSDDQVAVGIWYHDEEDNFDEEAAYTQDVSNYKLGTAGQASGNEDDDYMIPPHGKLMTQGFFSFGHPVRIDSWQPHMHLRGVAMSMEIYDPATGHMETASKVSNWNAGWNHSHTYEDGYQPLVPAGSTLILKGWHDNTANNPFNPDPDQWVTSGQRTGDEMSHAWIAVTHLDQEGYEKLLAERKERDQRTVAASGGAR